MASFRSSESIIVGVSFDCIGRFLEGYGAKRLHALRSDDVHVCRNNDGVGHQRIQHRSETRSRFVRVHG